MTCPDCASLRQRVDELTIRTMRAEAKNRAAAGLLVDAGMIGIRARVMADTLLGDDPDVHDRETQPEIHDTDRPPSAPDLDEASVGDLAYGAVRPEGP